MSTTLVRLSTTLNAITPIVGVAIVAAAPANVPPASVVFSSQSKLIRVDFVTVPSTLIQNQIQAALDSFDYSNAAQSDFDAGQLASQIAAGVELQYILSQIKVAAPLYVVPSVAQTTADLKTAIKALPAPAPVPVMLSKV